LKNGSSSGKFIEENAKEQLWKKEEALGIVETKIEKKVPKLDDKVDEIKVESMPLYYWIEEKTGLLWAPVN
jgi:hypothetical protein